MPKISRLAGTTSQKLLIHIQNCRSSSGSGLTGLLFNSQSLICYYKRSNGTASVAVTLATIATLGTYATGGFKEVDATNMPGLYEFHPPDAALAAGADSVVFYITGYINMVPKRIEIELTAVDNQNAATFGITDLPQAPMQIKKNQALAAFEFLMVALTDHSTPLTGLTVTATRSIDGGAFASCTNSVSEVASGIYKINLSAADLNGTIITLLFTGSGADSRYITLLTQA